MGILQGAAPFISPRSLEPLDCGAGPPDFPELEHGVPQAAAFCVHVVPVAGEAIAG